MATSTRRRTSGSTDKAWAQGFLTEILKTQEDVVPPGFHTAKEWGEIWGVSRDTASRYINVGLKQGLMECRKIKIMCSTRGFYPVPHFGPIKKQDR